MKVSETEAVPATWNNPQLAARMKGVFVAALGENNVVEPRPEMASEDFGLLGLDGHQIPTFMFLLGANFRGTYESKRTGTPLPSLHSSLFYPEAEPAIRTGVIALTSSVVELMSK